MNLVFDARGDTRRSEHFDSLESQSVSMIHIHLYFGDAIL